jgi:hypothetical protein
MSTFSHLKQQAKIGDPQAIAILMNRSFQRRGVTAAVTTKGSCLQVLLESLEIPQQSTFVSMIWMGIHKLAIAHIHTVEIYGKQVGEEIPCWSYKIYLNNESDQIAHRELSVGNNLIDSLHKHPKEPLLEQLAKRERTPQSDDITDHKTNLGSRFWSRLNFRAAIYGFLMDVIGTELTSFVLTMVFSIMLAMQGKSSSQIQTELTSNNFLIVYRFFGIIFSIAGGFLTAHCTKHDKILNAALTGIISVSLGCLMTYTNPAYIPNTLHTMALLLTIPMAIAGGLIRKFLIKKQMRTILIA